MFLKIKNLLTKKRIKGIVFLLLILIFIFIIFKALIFKNNKVSYWANDIGPIQMTAISNNGGNFFVYFTFSFKISNKQSFNKILKKKFDIITILRQEISKSNYYQINTYFKRQINLIPIIDNKIRKFLLLKTTDKLDMYFPQFIINKNESEKNKYFFNLNTFQGTYQNLKYLTEVYIIYDYGHYFLKFLEKNQFSNLKKEIRNSLDRFYIKSKNDSFILSISLLKARIQSIIENTVKNYFKKNNHYKIMNKNYEEFYNPILIPSIMLGYFIIN